MKIANEVEVMELMKVFKCSLVAVAFFNLVSCSSLDVNLPSFDNLLKAQTKQDGKACVRQRNIRGYGMLDNDVVGISASGKNRYYLVTTLFQCQSLQTGFSAGFKGDVFELCGGGFDKILTSEESCPIRSIFEFESREKAFANFEKVEKIRQDLREKGQQKAKEQAAPKNDEIVKNDETVG
jgi:hypothetical protein